MVPGPAKAFQCGEGKALRLKVCFWAGLGQAWGFAFRELRVQGLLEVFLGFAAPERT